MELKWTKMDKIILAFLITMLFCLIAGWSVYNLYGHQFIQALYESGAENGLLKRFDLMKGRNDYPLDHFLAKADWIFFEVISLASALFIFFLAFSCYLFIQKDKYYKPRPIEWFYFVAGLVLIQWYFWLMDDIYVLFRYIDNFLFLDLGFVYNQGEYVEGYSSPFWAVFITLLRATKLSYWAIFRLLSVVFFVLFWFMLVQLNRKLSSGKTVVNFPLAYLAFNYAVLTYFSSGMETTIVQIIAVAYALYILNPSSIMLQILLALSPFIRHELIIPFALCSLWTWLYYKEFPFRMVFMSISFVGSWVLFTIFYYADLFPNTFYLKDMVDINGGLAYVHDTLHTYQFYTIAAIFLSLIILLKRKHVHLELAKRMMMIVASLPITLYVIKIGGDFAHYRYIAFPFILTVCAFSGILEKFIETYNLNKYKITSPLVGIAISVAMFFLYPPQLDRHPLFITPKNAKATRIGKIYDVAQGNKRQELYPNYLDWGAMVNIKMMQEYKKLSKEFKYEDTIEAFGCKFAYIAFNKKIIHRLGLTDAILAHTDMKSDLPAHKFGLRPLGDDLIAISKSSQYIGKGMYRKAVEDGRAPEWIKKNLASIEIIERKIYNNHDFGENLKLAFTFPPKIKP